jgi:hypothetical protein
LERQIQEDAAKVDPETEGSGRSSPKRRRGRRGAEAALSAAHADVVAAREEVERPPRTAEVSGDLIEELEAKVAEAEARAKEAEEEALRVTPEANDLRARLAQAAARKRLGPSG